MASSSNIEKTPLIEEEECLICYEKYNLKSIIKCKNNHNYCNECFNNNIKNCCLQYDKTTLTWDYSNYAKIKKFGFGNKCVNPQCNSSFDDLEIINQLTKHNFKETATLFYKSKQELVSFETKKNEMNIILQKMKGKISGFDREIRRNQLKNALKEFKPKQCNKCNYGPITKYNCDNMQTHSHERKNGCPRCGKTYNSYKSLPDWDGKLPEETEVEKSNNINNSLQLSKINILSMLCLKFFIDNTNYYTYITPNKFNITIFNDYLILKKKNIQKNIPLSSLKKSCLRCHDNIFRTGQIYVYPACNDEIYIIPFNILLSINIVLLKKHIPNSLNVCGGNINGIQSIGKDGKCTSKCNNCGYGTHWSCCGCKKSNSICQCYGYPDNFRIQNVAQWKSPHAKKVVNYPQITHYPLKKTDFIFFKYQSIFKSIPPTKIQRFIKIPKSTTLKDDFFDSSSWYPKIYSKEKIINKSTMNDIIKDKIKEFNNDIVDLSNKNYNFFPNNKYEFVIYTKVCPYFEKVIYKSTKTNNFIISMNGEIFTINNNIFKLQVTSYNSNIARNIFSIDLKLISIDNTWINFVNACKNTLKNLGEVLYANVYEIYYGVREITANGKKVKKKFKTTKIICSIDKNNFTSNIHKITDKHIIVCFDKSNVPASSKVLTEDQIIARRKADIARKRSDLNKLAKQIRIDEKAAIEKAAKEKEEREKAQLEKYKKKRREKAKAAKEKAAKEKAAKEKAAKEKAARKKAAKEKAAREQAARKKAAKEKAAREQKRKQEIIKNKIKELYKDIKIYHTHKKCFVKSNCNCIVGRCIKIRNYINVWNSFNISNQISEWDFDIQGKFVDFIKNHNNTEVKEMFKIIRKHSKECTNNNCEYIDCNKFKFFIERINGNNLINISDINPLLAPIPNKKQKIE
jgi:hypothetical protein